MKRNSTIVPVSSSPSLCTEREPDGEVCASTPEPGTPNPKRGPGAPAGNRNAHIHGLYSARVTEALRRVIKENTSYAGLEREVMLAFWQFSVVNLSGATERVRERACARLIKLVRVKYNIGRDDPAGVENALARLPYDLPFTPELAQKLAGCSKRS